MTALDINTIVSDFAAAQRAVARLSDGPSLRQALVEMVAAHNALRAAYDNDLSTEAEIDALEDRVWDAREAAWAALARQGIDRKLAEDAGVCL